MIKTVLGLLLLSLLLFADSADLLIQDAFNAYKNHTLAHKQQLLQQLQHLALKEHNLDAAFLLATAYKNGVLEETAHDNALKWYRIAAEQGDHDAQLMIGWLFYQGTSYLQKDIKKAKQWFQKASDGGLIEATQMLNMLNR